jgi:hypothetical protein
MIPKSQEIRFTYAWGLFTGKIAKRRICRLISPESKNGQSDDQETLVEEGREYPDGERS